MKSGEQEHPETLDQDGCRQLQQGWHEVNDPASPFSPIAHPEKLMPFKVIAFDAINAKSNNALHFRNLSPSSCHSNEADKSVGAPVPYTEIDSRAFN